MIAVRRRRWQLGYWTWKRLGRLRGTRFGLFLIGLTSRLVVYEVSRDGGPWKRIG